MAPSKKKATRGAGELTGVNTQPSGDLPPAEAQEMEQPPPDPVPATAEPATTTPPGDMVTLLQGLTTVIERAISAGRATPPSAGSATPPAPRRGSSIDFARHHPPVFRGEGTALDAETWLDSTEKILNACEIPDELRIDVVAVQLEGLASNWWRAEQGRLGGRQVSWDDFKERFYDKYFPAVVRYEMVEQFVNLKQGGRSLETYIQEFDRLERFAGHIVPTEEARAQKFQRGLDVDIQRFVATQRHLSLDEAIASARVQEQIQRKDMSLRTPAPKRNFTTYSAGQSNSTGARTTPSVGNQSKTPQNICFRCGKPGHVRKDCRVAEANFQRPKGNGSNQGIAMQMGKGNATGGASFQKGVPVQSKEQTQGRVYAMTMETPEVVTGLEASLEQDSESAYLEVYGSEVQDDEDVTAY